MNKAVGEVIRELRKEYKVSQEKLADGIDSHQVYISEIEKGDKLPSLVVLRNIAKFFKLSLTELVARIEAKL
ncbi:MAG: helix-turn-helix transcriptional regulator [Spirochaetales bacterium]|nr:helix-turn-helix transcriptional regulator [Spirochaetales bacterium]